MNKIIYGIHSIETLLKYDYQRILNIYTIKTVKNSRLFTLIEKLKYVDINITIVNQQWLNRKTNCGIHQGIMALIKFNKFLQKKDLIKILNYKNNTPLILLILDSITDSRNLGACLRCADAAGVNAVIIPRHRSAKLNNIASKTSSGASEIIPLIMVNNLSNILELIKNYNITIIGTDSKANYHIYDNTFFINSIAIIIGSENKGMRTLTRKYCDYIVNIPITNYYSITSLNVSVVTGILLFEILRQRNFNKN